MTSDYKRTMDLLIFRKPLKCPICGAKWTGESFAVVSDQILPRCSQCGNILEI